MDFFFQGPAALEPDVFIEVGAKDGWASRRAAETLDAARIVALEANPYTYDKFQ